MACRGDFFSPILIYADGGGSLNHQNFKTDAKAHVNYNLVDSVILR